jgi:hypothetical protein
MNIKQTSWCITFVGVGCIPSVVVDEVSDKEPSIQLVLILGFLVEGGLLLVSWYRWWLGFLLSPIPILLIAESVSLWNETAMREALITQS